MSLGERIDKEADHLERRYEEESRMLDKNAEEFEVIEEVFDRLTLEGIFKLIKQKFIDRIHGVIKAGKEARIYWGVSPEGTELAIKIYYTATADFRRGMFKYIEGDPRFKRIRRDPRSLIYTWAQKEFKNLQTAERAGVNTPKPITFFRNILVMNFIGSNGVPAPILREIELQDPDTFYKQVLHQMKLLYTKADLVHGDLSEYNLMVWEEKPILFDLSQAVLKVHPMSNELIKRDISNLNSYFSKLGVPITESLKVERWIKNGAEDLS